MTPNEIAVDPSVSDAFAGLACAGTKEQGAEAERAVVRAVAEAVLQEVKAAIVAACSACGGSGYVVVTRCTSGHGCDGTEENCAQVCPVPIERQEEDRCEYCGRPNMAIAELVASLLAPATCPACDHTLPHGPAGCSRTLRKWIAEDRQSVGCESADGLIHVHPASETCEVCAAPERETPPTPQFWKRCETCGHVAEVAHE